MFYDPFLKINSILNVVLNVIISPLHAYVFIGIGIKKSLKVKQIPVGRRGIYLV